LASARASLRLSKFVPDKFVEPGEIVHTTTLSKNGEGPEALLHFWRRGWDSNPRYGKTVNRISNPAHSTTLPPLRLGRVEGREFYGARQQYTTRRGLRCDLSGSRRGKQRASKRRGRHDADCLTSSLRDNPCPISVKFFATRSPASAGASRVNNPPRC